MKKIYNYIMLLTLAFVAVCCSEEVIDAPSTSAQSGDDVQFTLSLNKESRTIYGPEANNAFPIYWVEGDKVQIFSPQALAGRRNAEYQVSVGGATEQNYANSLTKTGDYGVQWGDGYEKTDVEEGMPTEGYHDFYSLYPSGNYSLSGTQATGITINEMQNIVVEGTNVKSDMEDCLMYANKKGVSKGSVVNLQYDPISTVLMLTVKVAANEVGTDVDNFTIQSVTLEADAAIAGTFSLNISDGTFGEFEKNKSSETIKADIVNTSTGGYHTISNGESFEIPIFLAPISDLSVKNWKISIVANNNTYTKTLNIDEVLTPGQIHKITLPELKPATTEWEVSKWMTYIPRNVYLSEVSIPGSWNSLNSEFQVNTTDDEGNVIVGTDITNQYKNGVRAFHLDTRWKTSNDPFIGSSFTSTTPTGFELSVAIGGSNNTNDYDGGKLMKSKIKSFADYLAQITDCVQGDEYMVVICTFAQKSYDYTDSNGGNWVTAISNACANNANVYNAANITSNTLVGDVLGKVIVIVNLEGEVSTSTVPSNSKCLFINMPLTLTSAMFDANYNSGNIYKNTAADTYIDMYHHQAQICISGDTYTDSRDRDNIENRGFAPTFGERKTIANNILNWSKSNYGTENYNHDIWIYLGLGGYYVEYKFISGWTAASNGHSNVAKDFNDWINNKVTEMGTTVNSEVVPYYPVGIVLMNYANSYASTVKNILLLNNKYRLQYDSDKPVDYNPNALSVTNYSATATNGGNAFDTK